jgi:hypothetical protein
MRINLAEHFSNETLCECEDFASMDKAMNGMFDFAREVWGVDLESVSGFLERAMFAHSGEAIRYAGGDLGSKSRYGIRVA